MISEMSPFSPHPAEGELSRSRHVVSPALQRPGSDLDLQTYVSPTSTEEHYRNKFSPGKAMFDAVFEDVANPPQAVDECGTPTSTNSTQNLQATEACVQEEQRGPDKSEGKGVRFSSSRAIQSLADSGTGSPRDNTQCSNQSYLEMAARNQYAVRFSLGPPLPNDCTNSRSMS